MLRFILLAILLLIIARTFWKIVDAMMEGAGGGTRRRGGGRPPAPTVRLVRDPVCGTHIAPTTGYSLTRGGETHYFCSEKCRNAFRPGA